MIKEITGFLNTKGFLFSSFVNIEPKKLSSRKKIQIYSACDVRSNFISIFVADRKSRFLIKNAKEIIELKDKLVLKEEHNFKNNIFIIKSAVCSKAIAHFKQNNWIVYNDFM